MRPEHCLFDFERNMNYRISKVKRNPFSDSYAVKSGNLKKIWSVISEKFYPFFFGKFILKGNSHTSSKYIQIFQYLKKDDNYINLLIKLRLSTIFHIFHTQKNHQFFNYFYNKLILKK